MGWAFSFMEGLPVKGYQLINILSLDIAIGAVISAGFFSSVFKAAPAAREYVVLGITVWIIYTIDHLLDAKRVKQRASTNRHFFHQKYFKAIAIAVGVVIIIDLLLITDLPTAIIEAGIILAFPVGLYLLLQRKLLFLKELVGAAFYTTGILLPAVISKSYMMSVVEGILIMQFFIVAWSNLLLFSLFDRKHDEQDKHVSFTTQWDERRTKSLIIILFVIGLGLGFTEIVHFREWSGLILVVMNLILVTMVFYREFFQRSNRYRVFGDAIFFLPLLYCLV